jgi:hypothetical protein
MTSTVATEIPQAAPPAKPLLETWGKNERMRHIPPVEWIAGKVDGDLRRRIDIACASFERLSATDPRRSAAEQALNAVCRSLERVADVAKHTRPATSGGDVAARVRDAVHHAVANLNTIDGTLFGRRYPVQTFERSKAEPLFGAILATINGLNRAVEILRETDSSLDERLLDGLVTLQTPLRSEPIA